MTYKDKSFTEMLARVQKSVSDAEPQVSDGVPRQLATPTSLTKEQSKAIEETINPIVATTFALYVKSKNFHWHLYGPHYRDYHLLFDEHADALFDSIDKLAERVRRTGGVTIKSIGQIAKLQTIKDCDDMPVAPQDMIKELLQDNVHCAETLRNAIETCEKNRDYPTSNLLQEILDQTERRIWFLFEISVSD